MDMKTVLFQAGTRLYFVHAVHVVVMVEGIEGPRIGNAVPGWLAWLSTPVMAAAAVTTVTASSSITIIAGCEPRFNL
nr:hypothetical protein [Candidatus Sigynarchaeota archaeon]